MASTVAEVVVSALRASGVRRVYGIPGDSLNGFTDALRRDGTIAWQHVRHEEAAAFAAAAEAALTGRPWWMCAPTAMSCHCRPSSRSARSRASRWTKRRPRARPGGSGPRPGPARALAAALDHLNTVVEPHLDDEEQKVVPLAAVTLTQQEWDEMGKQGAAWIPRSKRGIAFGMMLEPLGEADRAFMMRHLPAPVRMLYPFLIERPWKKYASTLRNGT